MYTSNIDGTTLFINRSSCGERCIKHPATITLALITAVAFTALTAFGVLALMGKMSSVVHLKDMAAFLTENLDSKYLLGAAAVCGIIALGAMTCAGVGVAYRCPDSHVRKEIKTTSTKWDELNQELNKLSEKKRKQGLDMLKLISQN